MLLQLILIYQNYLTDENVEKIITTYQNRSEIEKYSHLAPLSEIAENDYNLNIPRYVDTFEEEEVIDLDAVALNLREIDTQMKMTDTTIAAFCAELGISAPF